MRIAYFSPLSPLKSGIADYSEELLPHLARHASIDVFVEAFSPSNPEITRNFAVHGIHDFERMRWSYDIALYHMGNHPCHKHIYQTLTRFPGVTVLHDYVLHHFVLEATLARGDDAGYIREMGYANGAAGTEAARESIRRGGNYPTQQHPLNERVIASSLGIIAHSEFVRRLVQNSHPNIPVARIPHAMEIDDAPAKCRVDLDLPKDTFIIGSFGLATPEKRLDVVLRAFQRLRCSFPNSMLLLVGEVPRWNDLRPLVRELEIGDSVRITGFVDKPMLRRYIHAADVCVNLRYPTCGETSGIILRCMAAAKPTIVSHVGAFAELPNQACIKVFVDEREEDLLFEALQRLATNEALRGKIGQAAREHVRLEHAPENVASSYINFIYRVLQGGR